MTLPCQKLPNTTYFVTRRCVGREFLLHAAPIVQQLWEYLFAVGCERYDIQAMGYVVMSNHVHYIVHDPHTRLPDFTSWLHGYMARATNSARARAGTFWEKEEINQPEIADEVTLIDKFAYTLANPVRAGLVPQGHQWIGARSRPEDFLKTRIIKRPKLRFLRKSKLPLQVKLRLEIPPTYAHLDKEHFVDLVRRAVDLKEADARDAIASAGRKFLGVEALRRLPHTHRATSAEGRGRYRTRRPRVLAACAELREAVLTRMALFRDAYAAALETFRAGTRDVTFPAGTYKLRARLGLNCHPPP